MATVKIEESKILAAYKAADQDAKKLLEELYEGTIVLNPLGKIKTVEDAFKHLGREIPTTDHEIVCGVIEALNDGWKPNWDDSDEYKYYIWWNMQSSAFSVDTVDYRYSVSGVGSRLCFRSSELAEYCANQFKDLWRKYMLIED